MNSLRRSIMNQLRTKNSIVAISLLDNSIIDASSHLLKSHQSQSLLQTLPRLASFSTTSSEPLYSAVVFERLPIIMPLPPQWMIDYAAWQKQLTAKRFKTLPKEFTDEKKITDDQSGQSKEAKWKPQPRETPADKSGDKTTTLRRLDQRIFMLLQNKQGHWEFPHVQINEGETTRTAAERALREAIGNHDESDAPGAVQPFFIGNAPAAHVPVPQGTLFFHRCQLIQGKPSLIDGSKYKGVVWVAKDELNEYIQDEKTLDVLNKML